MSGHQRPNRGASGDHLTPLPLVTDLGPFDLDPCASVRQPWPTAGTMYARPADGLALPWFGLVWLNPPFGPEWPEWVEMLADHGSGIALINARTETRPFHRLVWGRADALFFFAGRLYFHRPITGERWPFNAGAPSVLAGYGAVAVRRIRRLTRKGSKYPGRLIRLTPEPA
jgi:hypothetical protein